VTASDTALPRTPLGAPVHRRMVGGVGFHKDAAKINAPRYGGAGVR
jgi:hypothetical protein